jgi:hypothetical protein
VPDQPPPQEQEPRWKRELEFWVKVATGLLVLFGLAFAGLGTVGREIGIGGGEDSPAVRLELKQAKPVNRPDVYEAGRGLPLQTRPTTPQVLVTVRNKGEEPALIERVRVTIEDSARLPICPFVGGAGPGQTRQYFYPINLQWLATPDELVVRHEMQQEVRAGRTGHFVLFFRTPPDLGAAHLYAVRVELIVEGSEHPLDLGRFILGVPGPVPRTGEHLPDENQRLVEALDHAEELSPEFALGVRWCYRRNLHDMRRVLARPGERAPAIAELADVQLAPSWRWLADRSPPREVVEPLLEMKSVEGQMLAVFAAELAGDGALLESTRQRAAATLMRMARAGGEDQVNPASAILYTRAALSMVPSTRAEDALRAAEARLQGEEEAIVNGIG